MPNIASLLKDEIVRLARKEIKGHIDPLRKASAAYRREIAALKRHVVALERSRTAVEKRLSKSVSAASDGAAGDEGSRGVRFSAKGLKTLRARLGLSAADFGRLAGVSGQSVYGWEQGKTVPRRQQVQALASLRGLGKREALAKLEAAQ